VDFWLTDLKIRRDHLSISFHDPSPNYSRTNFVLIKQCFELFHFLGVNLLV
jgi:hypothetical protein